MFARFTRRRFLRAAGLCVVPAMSASVGFLRAGESRSWRLVDEFAAPEAKQAVAADESRIFVVTNDRVAKYDRSTRQFVARSLVSPARHLNSAFVWGGKVYLANSNFPDKPEKSQIYQLHIGPMRLEVFHDFGNFGGSLVWCINDDDYWWCNFAHYGDDNQKTFLARFDFDWNETGRWTYPKSVFDRIGKMSFSGGVWYKDELLVSDHDNRRLYRFQVPKRGEELQFLGEVAAPLTGQGFAYDPKTGGLIGIDRARKKVLFMEPAGSA
ncbi:MAG: hypothetical protein QM775_10005 [Pirellulales bacterium]